MSSTSRKAIKVGEARAAARQWAAGVSGVLGAYTAGSTNWLPDDAELPAGSDVDVMVVTAGAGQPSQRGKFLYRDVLLEASYLADHLFRSPGLVLSDYHLAPSFQTAHILVDPSAQLTALQSLVRREYARRRWIRQRCRAARDKVLAHLRSIDETRPLHDQATAWLFGTGVTTHVLLAAGLRNPTVRTRYVAVRELLAESGRLDFHENLLTLLGVAHISRERAQCRLSSLADAFDAATQVDRGAFPFASDLSPAARPIAIEASAELIERGYHREAMFWIAVTHSRCQKALAPAGSASYRDLLDDLGAASSAAMQQRAANVERFLPELWEAAEQIISANPRATD